MKTSGTAYSKYISEVRSKFKSGKATEHSYRGALQTLIESIAPKIEAVNEPKRVKCGAPDYIVSKGKIPIGYIEAKDLNENLDKVEKTEQLKRYFSALNNLILTDYLEFRWYVNGEKRLSVKIGKVVKGEIVFDSTSVDSLIQLLESFLTAEVKTIKSAEELARRLAGTTKNICSLIKDAYDLEPENGWLHKWLKAFSEVLISDLSKNDFADMFAQTLAYGFFAARVHHGNKGDFSRFAAAKILPKTNPFLRQLFAEFAGVNMPDEISWAVDEIVELLKHADIDAILKYFAVESGKDDPVVHFYETFLKAYDPKLREHRGVYYTPDAVVDYITKSVDYILEKEFKKKQGLADDNTLILDPAVGTASFLYKIVERVHSRFSKNKGAWDTYVEENLLNRIFGFEILMAPYSVAHLKLGLQLQETGYKFQKDQRLGVFLTNTLEESAKKSEEMLFDWISEEANAASSIKNDKPIMVVVGNPPYSGESANKGKWISDLMRGYDSITKQKTDSYFECEGKPLGEKNPKWLNDDYVKFIKFGQWRIEQTGHGVLAFVTNHGFLDNPTFRGMRESLLKTFDDLYVLDLHGNAKKKEKDSKGNADQNVFDIQQGVSISFFIKRETQEKKSLGRVYRYDLLGSRDEKYAWLKSNGFDTTKWSEINPSSPFYRFEKQNDSLWDQFNLGMKLTDVFPVNSVGIATARDELTIQYSEKDAWETVQKFSTSSDIAARNEWNLGDDARDWQVKLAQNDIKSSGTNKKLITPILYRPFDMRYSYYTGKSKGFMCNPRGAVMKQFLAGKNIGLISSRMTKGESFRHVHFTETLTDGVCISNKTSNNAFVFPLYLYDIDEQRSFENKELEFNISPQFIKIVSQRIGLNYSEKSTGDRNKTFGAEDVFYYISALLSSQVFQDHFAECLKVDFARIAVINNSKIFFKLADLGRQVSEFHLMKDSKGQTAFPIKGSNIVTNISFDGKKKIYINEDQYFEGVSEQVFNFFVGGYPVCEKWLKSRKGRKLQFSDITHFSKIVESVESIMRMQKKIDAVISECGGIQCLYVDLVKEPKKVEQEIKKVAASDKETFADIVEKRLSLAAKIVSEFEGTKEFSRVKFAKAFYLSDIISEVDLKTDYEREAAGPLDYRALYNEKIGIEPLAIQRGYFESEKKKGKKFDFVQYAVGPKISIGLRQFDKYFSESADKIKKVLELTSPMTRDQIEIVATVFACWNDMLLTNKNPTEENLLREFREKWHPDKTKKFENTKIEKARFTDDKVRAAVKWMKSKGLVPKGIGKKTKLKPSKREIIPF